MISAASRRTALAPRTGRLTGLVQLFALWRSRRALAKLDAARLEDIGVTQKMAEAEAKRPIWDVPTGWRQ